MKKSIAGSLVAATLVLSGCGGGSSTSSLFNTEATVAPTTVETGKEVAVNVTSNDQNSNFMTALNSVEESAGTNAALVAYKMISQSKTHFPSTTYALNETINESEACSQNGNINISGSGNDASGGKVTISYNQCKEAGVTMNGKMSMEIRMNNGEPSYMKLSIPSDFSVMDAYESMTLYAGSTMVMDNIGEYMESFDMTNSMKMSLGSKLYGSENSKWHIEETYSGLEMYQISGKEYIDNMTSYVTFDTSYDMSQTPFVFDYNGLSSGTAQYIGENNGKIKIDVTNTNEVTVFIDSDNDGTFESEETLDSFIN